MSFRPGFAVLLLSLAACAWPSAQTFPPEFDPPPSRRVPVAQDPFYGPLAPAAKALVRFEGQQRQTNHLCLVGYAWPDGDLTVWVHWAETRRLLLWRGNSDVGMREKGLMFALRDLQWDKDTVASEAQIGGSTYLVTRAWWQAVADDCAQYGQKLTLAPFD